MWNFSPLFCLVGDSMSGLHIPASDDLRRGSDFEDWRGLYRRPERVANRCAEGLRARSCAVRRKAPRRCGTRIRGRAGAPWRHLVGGVCCGGIAADSGSRPAGGTPNGAGETMNTFDTPRPSTRASNRSRWSCRSTNEAGGARVKTLAGSAFVVLIVACVGAQEVGTVEWCEQMRDTSDQIASISEDLQTTWENCGHDLRVGGIDDWGKRIPRDPDRLGLDGNCRADNPMAAEILADLEDNESFLDTLIRNLYRREVNDGGFERLRPADALVGEILRRQGGSLYGERPECLRTVGAFGDVIGMYKTRLSLFREMVERNCHRGVCGEPTLREAREAHCRWWAKEAEESAFILRTGKLHVWTTGQVVESGFDPDNADDRAFLEAELAYNEEVRNDACTF